MFKRLINSLLFFFTLALWLWCSLALFFYDLEQPLHWLAIFFALVVPLIWWLLPKRQQSLPVIFISYAIIIGVWSQKQPTLTKDWQASVAKLAYVDYDNDFVTIHNIRHFNYQTETEFTSHYDDKRFNIKQLNHMDYILSYWDGNLAVAHTMLSFGFSNGEHLAVSVETRLAKNQPQSGLYGLFKQYEVIYILADEADILRLRTNFRQEQVFVYPLNFSAKIRQAMFLKILERVNQLYQQPEFYNTMTQNCFTGLQTDFRNILPKETNLFDYRWFANGYSNEILYENAIIKSSLSFSEIQQRFHINQYTQNATTKNYSQLIRP